MANSVGQAALAKHLQAKGLDQAAFADAGPFSRSIVCMWLDGKRTPNADNRLRIAELTEGAVPVPAWSKRRRNGNGGSNGKHDKPSVRAEVVNGK